MPTEYPKRSTDPIRPSPEVVESPKSGSVMIARIVGILCVAGGFVLGIQGLDNPDSPMLPTALGMIVAGLLGMSSKFTECTLGVKYRQIDEHGVVSGGPMYYLRDGLKKKGMK